MKIKLILILLAVTSPFYQKALAQSGVFDLHINAGYGAMAGSQSLVSNTGTVQTVVPYSLGAGVNLDLGASLMLSPHIGIGADLGYVAGMPVNYTQVGEQVVMNNTYTGMLMTLTPMLVLSAGNPGVNPYGKFGIVLANASFTYESTESGKRAHSGTYIDTYSGDLGVGFYGAFGIQFPLGSNMKLNLELFDRTLSYAPARVVNTQAFDGDQKLSTLTYVDKMDNSSANDTELKSYWPFSSAGLKIGLTFFLGAK